MHYTLQSGKSTTTCTFKCIGCGIRYPEERLCHRRTVLNSHNRPRVYRETFLHDFHIIGCSEVCIEKVAAQTLEKVKSTESYELLQDALVCSGHRMQFLRELLLELKDDIHVYP